VADLGCYPFFIDSATNQPKDSMVLFISELDLVFVLHDVSINKATQTKNGLIFII
jgi:hypothetical protein